MRKAASFAIAFFFVSGVIQGRLSMSSRNAAVRASIIFAMRSLPSAPKVLSTYSRPRSSPSARSVACTQRFHRGSISRAPCRNWRLKRKSSCTNAEPR